MVRSTYSPDQLGIEIAAPSGYYQPLEEGSLDYEERRVLYTLGSACVEASCCGRGSWSYLRVEGFLVGPEGFSGTSGHETVEVDTVEAENDRAAITRLLQEKHPGVRVEFR